MFNMEYRKAVEHAAIIADRTRQSAFLIGHDDDYAVLSYEPKLLGGRSIQEVRPTPEPLLAAEHNQTEVLANSDTPSD
jgi:hypothetical protein